MQTCFHRRRRAALAFLFVALAGGLLSGCPAPALPLPGRVVSGSMAEHFWGEHWQVTCGDCGYRFRCGVEHPPVPPMALCPNCGFAGNALAADARRPGRKVQVVPRDFSRRPPLRWEVVAFREPSSAGRTAIKRIVGLAGERIAIRQGELFVNDRWLRKSYAELAAVAVPVNDDTHRPQQTAHLPPRWQPAKGDPVWQTQPAGYRFDATVPRARGMAKDNAAPLDHAAPGKWHWLEFTSWRGDADPARRTVPWPVLDDYGYNQGQSRQLNRVADLLLRCEAQLNNAGPLAVRLRYGGEEYEVLFDPPENELLVRHQNRVLAAAPSSAPLAGGWRPLAVALCDGQILVAVDHEPALAVPVCESPPTHGTAARPLAIGVAQGQGELRSLSVLRDIFYLDPQGRSDGWQMDRPLGAGEYLLLGDNPSNSVDGRHFGPLPLASLVGAVDASSTAVDARAD